MSPILHQFGLDTLSPEQRLALAQALWDSVYENLEDQPISGELQAELERRVALADANPDQGKAWEEVRAEAKARWAR